MRNWIEGRLDAPIEVAIAAAVAIVLLLVAAIWNWRRRRVGGTAAGAGAAPPAGDEAPLTRADRFRRGLAKSRAALTGRLAGALGGSGSATDDAFTEIE